MSSPVWWEAATNTNNGLENHLTYIYESLSINKIAVFATIKKLVIASTVYHCTFFKEIDSDESFHIPDDCQHDLIY